MKKINFWLLLLILLLATFLRLWHLGSNPAGFFCDEASIGYNAYSILKTGKDEYGERFPLFFRAFGEYKNPVMIYSTVPFVAVFGLNEFAVRLVSAFYGLMGVGAIYLLGREIYGPLGGLFSALFLAISPWHVHLSRVSLEGQMAFVFFTTVGIFLWFKHWRVKKANTNLFLTSISFFAFALYSYFPARIFIPFFTLGLVIIEAKNFLKRPQGVLIGSALTLMLIFPLVKHIIAGPGMARWQQVSVFNQKAPSQAFEQIKKNYLAHFSIDFLFSKGDIDYPGQFITRHSVRGIGEFYWFQLFLIPLGLVYFIVKRKWQVLVILGWGLILYPLGSALSLDATPQSTRSVIGVIPLTLFTAGGSLIFTLFSKAKFRRLEHFIRGGFLVFFFFLIGVSFLTFFHLLQEYPLYSSDFWGWQYGPREIVENFLAHKEEYDQLVMPGEFNAPEIFLKFYGQDRCQKCMVGDFSLIDKSKKQLFAVKPDGLTRLDDGYEFLGRKEIFYPDGSLAFEIGEIKRIF